MKKTISAVLAVIIAAVCTFSAFAGTAPSRKSVLKELEAAASYVSNGVTEYAVDSAENYYYIAKAGAKGAEYYDGFLQSVKDNLNANGGKLVTADGENIHSYAAVIGIIDAMGGDPTDVDSVNLVELFEKSDISTVSNPYYYNIVIPVAAKHCAQDFVKSLCELFTESNYTMGSGMDYWGFSCDNTAMFISAVAQCGLDSFDGVLEDAVKVLETYKTEGGYVYNPEYGTAPNASSTALALMAKCEYYAHKGAVSDNIDELSDLYSELLAFKGQTNGSYNYDGTESVFSASDAVKGLESLYKVLPIETVDEDKTPEKPDVTEPNTNNGNAEQKNPDIPNTDGRFMLLPAAPLIGIIFAAAKKIKRENAD